MSINGQMARGALNGYPDPVPYVYRGKDRLDDSNSKLCEGGCGRRLEHKPGPAITVCAVCRRAAGLNVKPREGGQKARPASERAR